MPTTNTMPTRHDFLTKGGLKAVILTRAELSERLPTADVEEINADFPGEDPLCFCWSGTSRWEGDAIWIADADDLARAGR